MSVTLKGIVEWLVFLKLVSVCRLQPPYLSLLKPQVLYWWWIHRQPLIPTHPSVCHTDEPQRGVKQLSVALPSLFGMTGEVITGSQSIGRSYRPRLA